MAIKIKSLLTFFHRSNDIATHWCLIERGKIAGDWKNPQNLFTGVGINRRGLEINQKCYREGNGLLSIIYIKLAQPSPQNEPMLNYAAYKISVLLMIFFAYWPKYLLKKLPWVRCYLQN